MRFLPTSVKGAFEVELEPHADDRGFFARFWCQQEFTAHGLNPNVLQCNLAFSRQKGTVRGLHFQLPPHQEAKLVRCTAGAIYDVAVDVRPDSETYKRWFATELTAENHRLLYVPEGCATGYQTLADNSEMHYQTTQFFAPAHARGIRFDDLAFGIKWPLPVTMISQADRSWPDFAD